MSGRRCRAWAVMLLALSLGACAGPRWLYDKRGVTTARYDHDLETCRREAFRPGEFALSPSRRFDEDVVKRCMERKGYTAVPAP